MKSGSGGMGMKKHARSGFSTQSPRFRFLRKLEIERESVKSDKKSIRDPKSSIKELFKD